MPTAVAADSPAARPPPFPDPSVPSLLFTPTPYSHESTFGVPARGVKRSAAALYADIPLGITFGDALDSSRRYLNVNVVELAHAEALKRVSDDPACRIDILVAAANLVEAKSIGLLAFLQSRADLLKSVTFQSIEPSFVPSISPSSALPQSVRCMLDPAETAAAITALAHGTDILRPDDFRPNFCDPPQCPAGDSALPLELHVQADIASGRAVVLLLSEVLLLVRAEQLDLNGASAFLVRKTDKPLGRAIINFSGLSPLNSPRKKQQLADTFGAMKTPTMVNYCSIGASVHDHFPDEQIVCFKSDFSAWFKRIRLTPRAALLSASCLRLSDGQIYVVLPLTNLWGCQEANFQSALGSSVLEAREIQRAQQLYNIPTLGAIYVDDSANFGPHYIAIAQTAALAEDAVALAGDGVMNLDKSLIAPALTIIGWLFDNATRSVSLSGPTYLKILCVLYHEFPTVLRAGVSAVPVRLLQRLGSYMHIAVQAIFALRPFTRAIFNNMSHRNPDDMVFLSSQSIADITMWRTVFATAFADARWLALSWYVPPYVYRSPDVDRVAWAIDKASTADYVGHADAALLHGVHGIGAVARMAGQSDPFAVLAHDLPDFIKYITADASYADVHINILEAVAAVLLFAALAVHIRRQPPPSYPPSCTRPFIHVHLWTDNTSALYWLSKNRSRTPFTQLLFALFCHLQLMSGVVLTMGHIPGVLNVFADAISRHFQVPHGTALRAQLSRPEMLQWTLSSQWVNDMMRQSTEPSLLTSSPPLVARTLVEQLFSSHSV